MIILKINDLGENSLHEAEGQVILRALRQCHGHVESAARLLGIGVSTMYQKIKKHDIGEDERQ